MTTFFVDTSALGRRYLNEVGTSWTLSWITPTAGNVIVIAGSYFHPFTAGGTFVALNYHAAPTQLAGGH